MNENLPNICARLAIESDCKNVFEWRNDTLTRSMSHSSEIIEWNQHIRWFSKSLFSKNKILVICEKDKKKISFVYFDIAKTNVLISINLNPNWRGKGLAKFCLMKSIEFFSEKYGSQKNLVAQIKENNILSQKIFLSLGFEKYKITNNVGYYQKNLA